MRSDKNLAIKLRLSGKSYSQINSVLKVPKSTLSIWLKDIVLSDKAKDAIQSRTHNLSIPKLIARNKEQSIIAKQNHKEIYEIGVKEANKLLKDPLFILGTSLYWAEGYKKGWTESKWKSIDFANSDSDMIKVMMLFFKKFLKVTETDIKIQIMLHDKRHIEKSINFWQNTTGVPRENFFEPCCSISKASGRKRKSILEYGTIHLRINNVKYFFRLAGWIDSLKTKFI